MSGQDRMNTHNGVGDGRIKNSASRTPLIHNTDFECNAGDETRSATLQRQQLVVRPFASDSESVLSDRGVHFRFVGFDVWSGTPCVSPHDDTRSGQPTDCPDRGFGQSRSSKESTFESSLLPPNHMFRDLCQCVQGVAALCGGCYLRAQARCSTGRWRRWLRDLRHGGVTKLEPRGGSSSRGMAKSQKTSRARRPVTHIHTRAQKTERISEPDSQLLCSPVVRLH